jgi:hypothetical protein
MKIDITFNQLLAIIKQLPKREKLNISKELAHENIETTVTTV